MAFPVLTNDTANQTTTSGTGHTVSLPTVSEGDLLGVISSYDGNPTITEDGGTWTKVIEITNFSANSTGVFWLFKAGASPPSSVSFTSSASENGQHTPFSITGWQGTLTLDTGFDVSAGATAADAFGDDSPNPDSLTVSWTSGEDNLFIACAFMNVGTTAFTGYPYTDNQATLSGGGAGSGAGHALCSFDTSAQDTQDPGVFTLDTGRDWGAFTVAIRPAAGGGEVNVNLGTLSLTGNSPVLGYDLQSASGSLSTTGNSPTLGYDLQVDQGSLSTTANKPVLGYNLMAKAGSLTLSAFQATVNTIALATDKFKGFIVNVGRMMR